MILVLLQTDPAPAPEQTVVLEPAQLQTLIEHQAANTQAVMLGIGLLLLFLSALVLMTISRGR